MPLFIFNVLVAVCLSYLVLAEPHQTPSDWVKGLPEQVSQLAAPSQPSQPEISTSPSAETVLADVDPDPAPDLAPVQKREEERASDPVVRDVQQALLRVEEKALTQMETGQESQNTVAADPGASVTDQAEPDLSDAGEGAAIPPTTPRFMSAQERQIALAALIEDLQLFALDKAH